MQFVGPFENREENSTRKKLQKMHLPVPIMHEPCSLSISTRGIGLTLAEILPTIKFCCTEYDSDGEELLFEPDFQIGPMYRASLAQLEAKMYFARENQSAPFSVRSATKSSLFSSPKIFSRRFMYYEDNLGPIALIINSIGHVEVNGKHFEPRFLDKPSPLNIRITNLRKYCVDMSSEETAWSERVAGYELNSIPNAKWIRRKAEDPHSVYLSNPDEIIPANYNDSLMEEDLIKLTRCLSRLKYQHHYLCGVIQYTNCGDPGMLVSTQVVPGQSIRLSDMRIMHNESRKFWSPECIEPLSWTIGAIGLAGEILDLTTTSQRSQSIAIQENDVNRVYAVNCLIWKPST